MCHADRPFGCGEQVFIHYGPRTCADQLIHNGFVDTNNSHNALYLKIALSKSDALVHKRAALLRKLSITTGEHKHNSSFRQNLDVVWTH